MKTYLTHLKDALQDADGNLAAIAVSDIILIRDHAEITHSTNVLGINTTMNSNNTGITNPPPSKPKIVVRKAADAMEGGSAGSSKKKKSGGLFGKRLDDT